jgi:hypothetical protein
VVGEVTVVVTVTVVVRVVLMPSCVLLTVELVVAEGPDEELSPLPSVVGPPELESCM